MKMRKNWVRFITRRFRGSSILVVGDPMLDRYIYGAVNRISPEAPVPVVRVTEEMNLPGGAANVVRNVRSLGGKAALSGIVGGDQAGRDLLRVLADYGVATGGMMVHKKCRTTVKTRIMAGRQQVARVDWDEKLNMGDSEWSRFRGKVLRALNGVSGVIIEDYGRGCVRQDIVSALLAGAARRGIPVTLDPKENSDLDVRGITAATPNRREAFALAGITEREPADNPVEDVPLRRAADVLMERWTPAFLVVTLGAHGMLLVPDEGAARHIPTAAREVFDVSGAGDTVIAAMTLGLASGADPYEAAQLANCAAGVVVSKVGTAGCTAAELERFSEMGGGL